jgi:hypothetical protein
MRIFLIGVLVLLGGCASTQAERNARFHRCVQPGPGTEHVYIDTLAVPHRCYALMESADGRCPMTLIEVDCETHEGVLEMP